MFDFVDVPGLDYDIERLDIDSGRKYKTPNGELYESVTTFLSRTLPKEALILWEERVGSAEAKRIANKGANRGTILHNLAEGYIKNSGYIPGNLNPLNKHLFKQVRTVIDGHINNIHCMEKSLFSNRLKLAGSVDLIAEFDRKLSIIDYKSSRKEKKEEWILGYFLQTLIYSLMYEERTGIKVKQLVVIIGLEEGTQAQVFVKRRKDYIPTLLQILGER